LHNSASDDGNLQGAGTASINGACCTSILGPLCSVCRRNRPAQAQCRQSQIMCYSHSYSHLVSAAISAPHRQLNCNAVDARPQERSPRHLTGMASTPAACVAGVVDAEGRHDALMRRDGDATTKRATPALQRDIASCAPRSALLATGMALWQTASLSKGGNAVFQGASLSLPRRSLGQTTTGAVLCRLPGVLAPVPTRPSSALGSSPLVLGKTNAFSAVRLLSCRKAGSGEPHGSARQPHAASLGSTTESSKAPRRGTFTANVMAA
jgi:hypothetical protein